MNEDLAPDPVVLGRILLLQSTFHAAPDEQRLMEMVAQELASLPGVSDCVVCIEGATTRIVGSRTTIRIVCCPAAPQGADASFFRCVDTCTFEGVEGWQKIEVRTLRHRYGMIHLDVQDQAAFAPYLAFAKSTANLAALLAENGRTTAELSELNRGLDGLVGDRTRELQASENRLREAQRVAHFGSFESDVNGSDLWWSNHLYHLFGLNPDQFTPTKDGFIALLHSDDKEEYAAAMNHSLESGEELREGYRARHASGAWRHFETIASVIRNDDGGIRGLQGTVQDISERKRQEALREGQNRVLKQLVAGEPLEQVLRTLVLTIERQTSGMLGSICLIQDDGEQRLYCVAAPSLPESYNALIQGVKIGPAVGSCGTAAFFKKRVIVEDIRSSPLWTEFEDAAAQYGLQACWSQPIIASAGHVLGTFALYYHQPRRPTDHELQLIDSLAHLTALAIERKRAEKERQELEAQLRQSQKMEAIGQLAGGVAHDFNNLLTAILGNTEILLLAVGDTVEPASAERLLPGLEEIQSAGNQAASLTRQLLAFSRREVLRPEVLDPKKIVIGMKVLLSRLISEHIQLDLKLNADTSFIHADPGQIEQVVMNLVVNAGDAMPNGGCLEIGLENIELNDASAAEYEDADPGRYVLLTVADNGSGMTPDTMEHIFEPFFTTKPVGKGTGLGLSTVYGTVKQLNGRIRVDSKPGEGTTFKVCIPVVNKQEMAKEPEGMSNNPSTEATILVCEDDDLVRSVMCRALRAAGYVVMEAAHGEQALEVAGLHEGTIDLLISDVVMPGLSGDELAARLTAERPDTRVLFVSGHTAHHLEGRLKRGGRDQLLQKPFGPRGLLKRVREILAPNLST